MNQQIADYIKSKKPTITPSTLKTYECIIRNLYKNIFKPEGPKKDIKYELTKFNTDKDKVLKYLKDIESRKRKTLLSALVSITDDNAYRNLMIDDIKEYNKEEAKQTKTKTQKENWVETDDLKELLNKFEHESKYIYKKTEKTMRDYQILQSYIILALFSGEYIPPRRALDYTDFKIKNIDTEKDNYKYRNKLIFNTYKTAKTYGKQEVKVPKKLNDILNKWIKVNPTDYLLFDNNNNQLNSVMLNQRLNKITGKKAGVNQMRKTYLTGKYDKSIDTKEELNKDMKLMGSSVLQENIYIKK
jgi:hypothetical protein